MAPVARALTLVCVRQFIGCFLVCRMHSFDAQGNSKWLSPGSGSSNSSTVRPEPRNMRARRNLDHSAGPYASQGLDRQSTGLDGNVSLDTGASQMRAAGTIPQYVSENGSQGAAAQNIMVRTFACSLCVVMNAQQPRLPHECP